MATEPLYVLDTNCWINAAHATALEWGPVVHLLQLADRRAIRIAVSRHSLHELEAAKSGHDDGAFELALRYSVVAYYPVGTINELIGSIGNLAGTFDDMDRNHELERRLEALANRGTDLRDRGAVIDALQAGATAFVTSDRQLVAAQPAQRIRESVGLRMVRPSDLVAELTTISKR